MKISIITVNLNNGAGLRKTVDSVLSQTFADIEYIIIDGGSADQSLEVIEQAEKSLTYWISEKDNGIYHAMNKGIVRAQGDYLLFLNSGDVLAEPKVFEKVAPFLNKEIVYGALGYYPEMSDRIFIPPKKLTSKFFLESTISHPATFIKRDLFKKVGLYDESYLICADWLFFMKAVCKHNVSYLGIPTLITIFNTEGISSDENNRNLIINERERGIRSEFQLFYDDYVDLKKERNNLFQELQEAEQKLNRLKRSKPYKLFKFIGHSKFK